jgi:hypothetical protein
VITTPTQNNRGSRMTRVAVTTLAVAIAFYIAARLIEAAAPILIASAVVVTVSYVAFRVIRYRRDHWL